MGRQHLRNRWSIEFGLILLALSFLVVNEKKRFFTFLYFLFFFMCFFIFVFSCVLSFLWQSPTKAPAHVRSYWHFDRRCEGTELKVTDVLDLASNRRPFAQFSNHFAQFSTMLICAECKHHCLTHVIVIAYFCNLSLRTTICITFLHIYLHHLLQDASRSWRSGEAQSANWDAEGEHLSSQKCFFFFFRRVFSY